jgi:hypothetical protein
MAFTDVPTEQMTAITDLILSAQALGLRIYLGRATTCRPFWTWVWSWIFALLAFACLLGAMAHGFKMTARVNGMLWMPIYLALGLTVALFAVAAISYVWNDHLARRCLAIAVGLATIFFAVTQFWSDSFILFVVYEVVVMLFVLALYAICWWRPGARRGSGFLAAGVFIGLLAAVADTQPTMRVWTFDNHGCFHLIQMVSLIALSIGLYQSHGVSRTPS